jgi:hypothetical protein
MFHYTHDGYLMARTSLSPDVENDDGGNYAATLQIQHQRQGHDGTTLVRCMDESGQDRIGAVAVPIASPLGVQQDIHRLYIPPPNRSTSRALQL